MLPLVFTITPDILRLIAEFGMLPNAEGTGARSA